MTRAVRALLVLTWLAAAFDRASAQDFEGVVTLRASRPSANGTSTPLELQYYSKKGDVRVEMGAGTPNSIAGIILTREKKVYRLMSAQSLYTEDPLPDMSGASSAGAPKVTRTGKSETVAGYSCEHVLLSTSTDTLDLCLAKGLGSFSAAAAALGMLGNRMDAWQKSLIAEASFPMKISMRGVNMVEVTKVEKKFLSPGLFIVPDNYSRARPEAKKPS